MENNWLQNNLVAIVLLGTILLSLLLDWSQKTLSIAIVIGLVVAIFLLSVLPRKVKAA